MPCKFEDFFLPNSSSGTSKRFRLGSSLVTWMANQFFELNCSISIVLQGGTYALDHSLPVIPSQLHFVQSGRQQATLENLAKQISLGVFTEAINATEITARKTSP